jgi:uncharacterized protein (TIGR02265 family)
MSDDDVLAPEIPLTGTFDIEETVRAMPDTNRVKGMFFGRLSRELGDGWGDVQHSLDRPPRYGRYLPFTDYPQRDYVRLYTAAAKKRYPTLALRESVRRLARHDIDVFAESTVGGVMLAMVGDARSALSKLPLAYGATIRSAMKLEVEQLEESVRVTFEPHYGRWEYQLGQLEGVVAAFGNRSRIVTKEEGTARRFDIVIR